MEEIISWDAFFMMSAKLASLRSKDPHTKVGAILVNNKNRIIGSGYNGMPAGRDDLFPWNRTGDNEQNTKYPFVVHAELNCILNCPKKSENMKMYVTKYPCQECAKAIGQFGIRKLYYYDKNKKETKASDSILKACNVEIIEYKDLKNLTLTLQ